MKNKWFKLSIIAFLLSGASTFINKFVATELSQGTFQSMYCIASDLGGIILSLILIKTNKVKIKKKDFIIGIIAGIFSAIGGYLTFIALIHLHAYIVFTTIQVGMISLIAIISFLLFNEKMNLKEFLGLIFGILAIILIAV